MQTLYKGGLVFDGAGTLYEDHAVLTEGDTIAKLAPSGAFDGFAGRIVDTSGGTVLPGLIDCHVHLCLGAEADPGGAMTTLSEARLAIKGLQRARSTLVGGIVAVRDCGGRDHIDLAVRDACNGGHFSGPTIRASGRAICMTGGHGNRFGRVADGPPDVVKAVREQIHAGCDMIKMMATGGVMTPGVNPEDAHYSPEEMMAGVQEAKRFRRRTAAHAQGGDGILNAVRAGIDSVEHGIFMNEVCIEEMIQRGTFLVPTISALRNILRYSDHGIPGYVVEKARRVSETHTKSIQTFFRAGGRIAMGTDAGTPFNHHGDNARELAYLVEIGMPARDALAAATAHGAELMGLDDRGRIATGQRADLLIVDGNPVDDIACAADHANHRSVIKDGEFAYARPSQTVADQPAGWTGEIGGVFVTAAAPPPTPTIVQGN